MQTICFLVLAFFSMNIFAEDVEVVVDPKEVMVNETFFVTFKVKVTGDGEAPYISFNPSGASVQGKRSQGVSISTVVINGRFSTTKEQEIVYELLAEKLGQVYLKDIKVEMNGKTISVKDIKINVLSEARRIPDAFIETEASKTKVYLGEGLDVNYYLYFRTSINANDVKEFPKLNKFIKRFHHLKSPVETVQYKGQIFRRILAYSARLYPEKVGLAVLDPMKVAIQVIEEEYGSFGFGSQRYRNKELASPRIEIEVMPLPTEGVPKSFTGLVGEHEFNLQIPKTKYLVNEPIEIKLEVKGKGAVENFDAPLIYGHNNLEQFDTKSEVAELGMQAAKKVFEYTLLARGPLKIPASELPLAYFDPSSGKYVEKKVSIPALEVGGVAMPSSGNSASENNLNKGGDRENENSPLNSLFKSKDVEKNNIGLVGPSMLGEERWLDKSVTVINAALCIFILSLLAEWKLSSMKGEKVSSVSDEIKQNITILKKNGLRYSELYKVLVALDKENKMSVGGISVVNVVNESGLSSESKEYFKEALAFTEGGMYSQNNDKKPNVLKFEKRHFNELMKNL